MKFLPLFPILFLCSFGAFSQEKVTEHTIVKGDNIYNIAKKYNITQEALLDLNPDAKGILKLNAILRIPSSGVSSNTTIEQPEIITHKVSQKETLYGISKQYQVSIPEIERLNPEITKSGLKAEQLLQIPSFKKPIGTQKPVPDSKPMVKEAPVAEQKKVDIDPKPVIKPVVPVVEQKPVVESKPVIVTDLKKNEPNKVVEVEKTVSETPKTNQYTREVLQKETKYGIAREYGITVAELEKQNPLAKNGLKIGQILNITTDKVVENKQSIANAELPSATNKAKESIVIADAEKTENLFSDELADKLIFHASDNIGVRYRTGGTTKDGFDCSGLMCATFGNFDIQLPRTSLEQSQFGSDVSFAEAQKGDLIFFKTNGRSRINHVGMVVEVAPDEIKFIHAAVHGGVMISSTKETYYEKRFAKLNRVLKQP